MSRLLALLLLIFSSPIVAQNFDAGFIGGFTTSQVSGDNLEGYDKLGARMGAYISYPINRSSNFQIEMQFIQKGSKRPFDKYNSDTYSLKLNYIEVPVSINYELKKGISIEAGIGTAYLIKYYEERNSIEINSDSPKSIAVDYLLGVNYQFKKNLKINLRFDNSINPLRSSSLEEASNKNRGQYSTLLSLAFYYQISR